MNETTTVFDVKGMSCGSCIRHIREALERVPGVFEVEVQLREGTVRVVHAEDVVGAEAIAKAIGGSGYDVTGSRAA